MDIKFSIKGLSIVRGQIKAEDIDIGFSCTEGETLNSNESVLELLDNPAVQELIKKFTNEVSFKPVQPKAEAKTEELLNRVNELVSSLKKEREAYEKLRQTEREVVSELNRRITQVAERMQKF